MPDKPDPPTRKRTATREPAEDAAPVQPRKRAPRATSATGAAASAQASRVAAGEPATKKRAPAAAKSAGGTVKKAPAKKAAGSSTRRVATPAPPPEPEALEPVVASDEELGAWLEEALEAEQPQPQPLPVPEAELVVPTQAHPDRTRPWMIGAIVGWLATIGLAVALILTLLAPNDSNALTSAGTSALTAAQTYATELAGYDYRHLDQDFGVVLSHSTPSFKTSFTKSSGALKSTLIKYHATAVAKVVAAGVVSGTTSQVVVIVLLDQTVNNTNEKAPTTDRSQIDMTLVSSPSGWLIDQVKVI